MENSAASAKGQSGSASGKSTSRLLRYPLRSANKTKEEKPQPADASSNSTSKRGRVAHSVSKSVGVLDVSGKEKSAKPPRRLSVPSKPNASPAPKSFGNITPISEARAKRSSVHQGKSDTPLSEVSKSSHRRKFSAISSASYWLSQIKLSETAAKHSISLGFFKLALEAGCEPMQRMSDELKLYVQRHNLSELGEFVKELFENYKISENIEQSQGSQICNQEPPVDGSQVSDDDVNISSSSSVTEKPKPNPSEIKVTEVQNVKKANQETAQKDISVKKTRKSVPMNASNSKPGPQNRAQRKPKKKPSKQECGQDMSKVKQGDKSSACEEGNVSSPPVEDALEENKENMDYVGEVAVA